jgi:predicted Ser/Thr protein kinase
VLTLNWEQAAEEIQKLDVVAHQENELVTVKHIPEYLECVGIGTDAAVFQWIDEPNIAFKVFSPDKVEKLEEEKKVYGKLGNSSYFPKFYGSGPNFLMLSYVKGITLYDCLLKGIRIPEQAILDVDEARAYARKKGLNPRDIHLKNVLLHQGRAKVVDVSEYLKEGNDARWDLLKKGYYEYYSLINKKEIPYWVMEAVRKWYNQSNPDPCHFQEIVQKINKIIHLESKVEK